MMRFSSRKHEKGQALVEFALMTVFLLILILSFLELVMLVYAYIVLADAAKEGVRYAIVHGAENSLPSGPPGPGATTAPPCTADVGSNLAKVKTAVTNYASSSGHSTAGMNIHVCYFDGDNLPPHRVTVVVSYPYQPFFGMGWPTVNVNAAAEGRILF
jgi:hypothetical protein